MISKLNNSENELKEAPVENEFFYLKEQLKEISQSM
jgi:hypothetical protein